jgi:hypothetical protein
MYTNVIQFRKGSAILITMLFITVLAAMIFSILRPRISEIHSETSYYESQMAYYSAEAGLEEGLFRYRADKDVTWPAYDKDNPNNVIRRDLGGRDASGSWQDNNSAEIRPDWSIPLPVDKTHYYYDLKIYSRELTIGKRPSDCLSNPDGCLSLKKDQSKEFDVTFNAKTINLKWTSDVYGTGSTKCYVSMEWKLIGKDAFSNNQVERDKNVENITTLSKGLLIPAAAGTQKFKLRIRPLIGDSTKSGPGGSFATGNNAKCNDGYIFYQITPAVTYSPPLLLDTGTTTIESTGYFGNTARRIVAKIDKNSGAILDLYDFVLYSGVGELKYK